MLRKISKIAKSRSIQFDVGDDGREGWKVNQTFTVSQSIDLAAVSRWIGKENKTMTGWLAEWPRVNTMEILFKRWMLKHNPI